MLPVISSLDSLCAAKKCSRGGYLHPKAPESKIATLSYLGGVSIGTLSALYKLYLRTSNVVRSDIGALSDRLYSSFEPVKDTYLKACKNMICTIICKSNIPL